MIMKSFYKEGAIAMDSLKRWLIPGVLCGILAFPLSNAVAQTPTPTYNWQYGPAQIQIAGQAVLGLPAGYSYLGPGDTQRYLASLGNNPSGKEAGLVKWQGIAGQTSDTYGNWFMLIYFVTAGYVTNSDAANFNKNQMLTFFTQGTEEDNKQRQSQGLGPLHVNDWAELPFYDQVYHKMSWGLSVTDNNVNLVNYHLLKLGREGYFDLNMIGPLSALTHLKANAQLLFNQLIFKDGKDYAAFHSATDRVGSLSFQEVIMSGRTAQLP